MSNAARRPGPVVKGWLALPVLLLLVAALVLHATPSRAQTLYWLDTNYASPRLGWSNADGTNPHTLALAAGSLPEGLALDSGAGKLYWTEEAWSGARVNRCDANLAGFVALVSGGSSLRDIALDLVHGTMYWTSSNLVTGGQIDRANLDGSNHVVFKTLGANANPRGIAVNPAGGRVYWVDYDAGTVFSTDFTGFPTIPVVITTTGHWGLAFDSSVNRLMVTDYVFGRIEEFTLPSGPLQQVLGGLSNPTYLALDPAAGKMYWSEGGAGAQKIQRSGMGGGLVQNLNLPLATYGGLAIGNVNLTDVPGEPPMGGAITEFSLLPPAPNPARHSAHVEFSLPRAAHVTLRVLDLQGREVARLADGEFAAGRHTADWSLAGSHARPAAGLYFLKLESAGRSAVRRLALVR